MSPRVRSLTAVWPGHGCVEGSCKVHVMVNAVCGVKRTSSRPGNNAHNALTIYRGNVTTGTDVYWQRLINKLFSMTNLVWEPWGSLTSSINCSLFYTNNSVLHVTAVTVLWWGDRKCVNCGNFKCWLNFPFIFGWDCFL